MGTTYACDVPGCDTVTCAGVGWGPGVGLHDAGGGVVAGDGSTTTGTLSWMCLGPGHCQDILRTYLTPIQDTRLKDIQNTCKTHSRRIQYASKTSKTHPRRIQDTSKTHPRHIQDTSKTHPRHIQDTKPVDIQDRFKTDPGQIQEIASSVGRSQATHGHRDQTHAHEFCIQTHCAGLGIPLMCPDTRTTPCLVLTQHRAKCGRTPEQRMYGYVRP